jgi:hypothetical protein
MKKIEKILKRKLTESELKLYLKYKNDKQFFFSIDFDGDLIVLEKEIQEKLKQGMLWEDIIKNN